MKMLGALVAAVLASSSQSDPLAPLPETPKPAPAPLILQPRPQPVTQAPRPLIVQPQPTVRQPVYLPQPAVASTGELTGFAAYKVRLSALARSAGIREATTQSVIPYLQLNSRVIELDRSQRPTSTSGSAGCPGFVTTPWFGPLSHRAVSAGPGGSDLSTLRIRI